MYVNQGGAVVLVQQHFASGQLTVQNWGLGMVQVLQQISRGHQVVKRRCMPAGPRRVCLRMASSEGSTSPGKQKHREVGVTPSSPALRGHLHGDADILQDNECHLDVNVNGWVAQQVTEGTALHAHRCLQTQATLVTVWCASAIQQGVNHC